MGSRNIKDVKAVELGGFCFPMWMTVRMLGPPREGIPSSERQSLPLGQKLVLCVSAQANSVGCNEMCNMYDEEKRGSAVIPDVLLGLLELVKLRH